MERVVEEPSRRSVSSVLLLCDRGGADLDATGRPKILMHKEWFDPKEEPYDKERNAYQGLEMSL
jgi:hypothetical protein